MFRRLGNSPDGEILIKYLKELIIDRFDVGNIMGEVQLEGAKKAKQFIVTEIIDKINAFSGNLKVGEGGEEFR